MKIKALSTSHHRNGISGDPFNVSLIEDEDGTTKVCVDFGGMAFAVLDVAKLSEGDIAFGSNSYRGDRYAEHVRKQAEKLTPARTADSFYLQHPLRK